MYLDYPISMIITSFIGMIALCILLSAMISELICNFLHIKSKGCKHMSNKSNKCDKRVAKVCRKGKGELYPPSSPSATPGNKSSHFLNIRTDLLHNGIDNTAVYYLRNGKISIEYRGNGVYMFRKEVVMGRFIFAVRWVIGLGVFVFGRLATAFDRFARNF